MYSTSASRSLTLDFSRTERPLPASGQAAVETTCSRLNRGPSERAQPALLFEPAIGLQPASRQRRPPPMLMQTSSSKRPLLL
eukprot:7963914-Lingulodinium_polyedra.AAC.1